MQPGPALASHALGLLFLQLALILFVSRLLAEVMRRIGQPSVLGELLAGLVLGPSLFGWLSPGAFATVFPADPAQAHLLEAVAWLGMVLLLLLTGLETDVRLLRNLGRSAASASLFGLIIPAASGFVLGQLVPESYLVNASERLIFSAFLATAMSISAMPVIAKILHDLDLTKRNLGVVILSAGVVDDTIGWIVLSLIAGIASAHQNFLQKFGATVALTFAFMLAAFYVIFPLTKWLFRTVERRAQTANIELVLVVAICLVLSAVTEYIGIHAVFGAFVAGCILRQVPTLDPALHHRLESSAVSLFAPIFFGLVGLKVDLTKVQSVGLVLIVLLVASFGKIVGSTLGGVIGKLRLRESLAIGFAMNARGGMGLIVALIGLQLGILTQASYASLVVMAIATSFMAPVLLRAALKGLPLSPEESARIQSENNRGLFDRARLKILLPTAGGPHALSAGRIASALLGGDGAGLTLLYIEPPRGSLWRRIRRFLGMADLAGENLQQHLDSITAFRPEHKSKVEVRRPIDADPTEQIIKSAAGYQLLLIGAGEKNALRSSVTADVIERAPCHVAIVRGRKPDRRHRRILVVTNGSFFSRAAVELALLYAEEIGATLTVLYTIEADYQTSEDEETGFDESFRAMLATTALSWSSPLLLKNPDRVHVVVRSNIKPSVPVLEEAETGLYDLLIVGAEANAVQHRLGVGYDLDAIVERAPSTVMVLVPRVK